MISDAYVKLTCDGCEAEEEILLTATAKYGSYDSRNVEKAIASLGWKTISEDDEHRCANCIEDEENKK